MKVLTCPGVGPHIKKSNPLGSFVLILKLKDPPTVEFHVGKTWIKKKYAMTGHLRLKQILYFLFLWR